MKLAMAQMAMSTDMAENLKKSLRFCEEAKGARPAVFPEIQLCPFFPQYEKRNVEAYCLPGRGGEYVRFPPRRERAAIICRRTCILK